MTRLTGPKECLLFSMLTIVLVAQAPPPGYTEELSTQSDQVLIPELELIKEEETVSIASRYEQPISQAPANVYVITDEDIQHSGATDIPTVLRRIPGMEVMQTSGADFNVSIRGDNNLSANKLLVMVDGRSIYVDVAGYMRDAEVAISAFNALNDTHKEHPLGDTIGSRVMGWITVRY